MHKGEIPLGEEAASLVALEITVPPAGALALVGAGLLVVAMVTCTVWEEILVAMVTIIISNNSSTLIQ